MVKVLPSPVPTTHKDTNRSTATDNDVLIPSPSSHRLGMNLVVSSIIIGTDHDGQTDKGSTRSVLHHGYMASVCRYPKRCPYISNPRKWDIHRDNGLGYVDLDRPGPVSSPVSPLLIPSLLLPSLPLPLPLESRSAAAPVVILLLPLHFVQSHFMCSSDTPNTFSKSDSPP